MVDAVVEIVLAAPKLLGNTCTPKMKIKQLISKANSGSSARNASVQPPRRKVSTTSLTRRVAISLVTLQLHQLRPPLKINWYHILLPPPISPSPMWSSPLWLPLLWILLLPPTRSMPSTTLANGEDKEPGWPRSTTLRAMV